MKKNRRLLALVLSAAMVLSLFAGCAKEPEPTTPPTTEPPPTEAPGVVAYREAAAALEQQPDLVLRITAVKTTTVAGESFTEESDQTLSYSGLGTGALKVHSKETVDYADALSVDFEETYADGTLYLTAEDAHFSAELTAEECARRYLPAVMLDLELYGSVEESASGSSTILTFADPTAAEAWAMPEDAELVEASGTAQLSAAGEIQKYTYSLSYTYYTAEVTLEVSAYVNLEQTGIEAPADADTYIPLEYIDAVRLYSQASGYLRQAETATITSLESTISYAGGVIQNQSESTDYYAKGEDLLAKIDNGIYLVDYTTNETLEYDLEEIYNNGTFTVSEDGGEPEVYTTVEPATITTYCTTQMTSHFIDPIHWQDATITDTGSTWLIECNLTEEYGDITQSLVCYGLFGDGSVLSSNASAYAQLKFTYYLAVDKYTGLPTAAGYHYEGQHTLDGVDYPLSFQTGQSIAVPSLGAYESITEEKLPEEEPETKATPLFYHVTGADGQEMWLFGTIHVGDERTAYLPQEIYDAFSASDALALEFDSDAFEEQCEEDDKLQDKVSDAYYFSDGSTIVEHLDEEVYEAALKLLKASGNYNMNAEYMKAYTWSSSIDNFYLRQGYALTSEQGVEARLKQLATEQEKEVRDVESGLFQVQMLTGFSEELQEAMLKDSVDTDMLEYVSGTIDLFEKWCEGDETVLRETINEEDDTSDLTEEELAEYEALKPLWEEYDKAISTDRNEGMLQVAIEYLESGDVVFFAVGLAHLLDETNGLVDTLREAGYTVELVTYN